jgi:hypothetical protein
MVSQVALKTMTIRRKAVERTGPLFTLPRILAIVAKRSGHMSCVESSSGLLQLFDPNLK